jgi:hypothetical protein
METFQERPAEVPAPQKLPREEGWLHDQTKSVKYFRRTAIIFILLGAALFLISIIVFLTKTTDISAALPIDPNILGNLGNVIGGLVGAIWSLSGIFLFYAALTLQRADLSLQREELVKAREIAEEQAKTFQLQRFENTFFQLVNLHHEIVKGIDLTLKPGVSFQGRDCFKRIYDQFVNGLPSTAFSGALTGYLDIYAKHESDLGHYFRNLYHIFKYIHNSGMSFPERHVYANFARAQLSSYELLLLFYNCLSLNGVEKFKPLIEEYQVLKNMPKGRLIHPDHLREYRDFAFERASGNLGDVVS